ncbi:hypothetical protein RXV94_07390 [Yeosuana sp. MJ-SS3]|uniref:Uncharacterized protein n=1 Tax=Gilvirhabdus luticola TaxID=3079858 RepID=A0ABU3U6E5_9FLAO|nr:hypothetical protein [Yeosuana sp. MJ-SS3]MDU8885979.1 hypothetical protein [Yeosuana sp. MJ-SS3]
MKWHFSILILFFTFFGILSQNEVSVPNQEIVLQFKGVEVTSQEAQSAIAIVKKHLQDIGADNIHVKKNENGKLKITYHSDVDISCVKESLSKEKKISFDYIFDNEDDNHKHIPSDDNLICYNFDIYEIQNGVDTDLDLNGIVLKKKTNNDRFFEPNVFLSYGRIDVRKENRIFKVSYDLWRNIVITIENPSYSIPEVRAGPVALGNA